MRRIIESTYATLDGFIDNPPEWTLPYSDERSQQYAFNADHINAIAKYVIAAEPMDIVVWGSVTIIRGNDLVAKVTQLKETDGGHILVRGQRQSLICEIQRFRHRSHQGRPQAIGLRRAKGHRHKRSAHGRVRPSRRHSEQDQRPSVASRAGRIAEPKEARCEFWS